MVGVCDVDVTAHDYLLTLKIWAMSNHVYSAYKNSFRLLTRFLNSSPVQKLIPNFIYLLFNFSKHWVCNCEFNMYKRYTSIIVWILSVHHFTMDLKRDWWFTADYVLISFFRLRAESIKQLQFWSVKISLSLI